MHTRPQTSSVSMQHVTPHSKPPLPLSTVDVAAAAAGRVARINFRQPHTLAPLFELPYAHPADRERKMAFLDDWLSNIYEALMSLRGNLAMSTAFGLGSQYVNAIQSIKIPGHAVLPGVVRCPYWEHKVYFILVYIMASTEAYAALRPCEKIYIDEYFRPQFTQHTRGRTANGDAFGNGPGQCSDIFMNTLMFFVHTQLHIYKLHGFDL